MIETSPSASRPPHTQPDSDTESTYSSSASCANNVTANQARAHRYVPRKRKHKILGLKSQVQRGNDPYDYEQKYPEDEPYKEMGPMARIWKVFLDECTKFDAEMTEDWKDALDVLLVFAGLFSAVVTTFVSQTSQKLQRDFTEVTAYKMDEMTKLLRVVIAGNNITDVPPSSLSVATKFVPERSDLWVNGLWFTSLALSLTTALLAVLTKQWIHQYMSVPSGTPRDRSRIRQFRFNSLEKWRVPVIIGLLPVLMHVSLGVFFAGLIVYLRNLDTPMSGVVTFVAVVGFVAYTGSNLLPLFKPDCPYKTPLTLHSHGATVFLWSTCRRLIQRWKQIRQSGQKTPATHGNTIVALSLREVEKVRVEQVAEEIEAQCLSWLFNISSNSSVQRVVAQALSQVPLQSVKSISEKIPGVHDTIQSILFLPEHRTEDNNPIYERLFRALVKFRPELPPPPVIQLSPAPNSLALLLHSDHSSDAAALIREEIMKPTTKLDALSWFLILYNALSSGTDWLDAHNTDSRVWKSLLARFVASHRCLSWDNCEGNAATLCRLYTPPRKGDGVQFSLEMLDLPHSEVPHHFLFAVGQHMSPSVYKLLWITAFPTSSLISFPALPPDICLQLDLMRLPYIQEGFGYSGQRDNETIMMYLITIALRHLDIEREAGNISRQHPDIVQATFPALCDVVSSDSFVSGCMTFHMKCDVLRALFRTLVDDPNLTQAFFQWLSPSMITRICDVAFVDIPEQFPSPLIIEILEYERGAGSARGTFVSAAYAYLSRRGWLEEIQDGLLGSSKGGPKVHFRYTRSYPFLASEYVECLATLQRVDPSVYEETLLYLQAPRNTLVLSKLLLLTDESRRHALLKLVGYIGRACWTPCCRELQAIFCAGEGPGRELYRFHVDRLHGKHPFRTSLVLSHGTYKDLEDLLSTSIRFNFAHTPSNSLPTSHLTLFTKTLRSITFWRARGRSLAAERIEEGERDINLNEVV